MISSYLEPTSPSKVKYLLSMKQNKRVNTGSNSSLRSLVNKDNCLTIRKQGGCYECEKNYLSLEGECVNQIEYEKQKRIIDKEITKHVILFFFTNFNIFLFILILLFICYRKCNTK